MRALMVVILASLALVGCSGGGSVQTQDDPPPGTIWFGTAYDTGDFHLTNRGTTFPAGQQVAVVAHMSTPPGNVAVQLYLGFGGTQVAIATTTFSGQLDIMADLVPAIYFTTPGQYPFQAKDAGGNVLATGTVTIRP